MWHVLLLDLLGQGEDEGGQDRQKHESKQWQRGGKSLALTQQQQLQVPGQGEEVAERERLLGGPCTRLAMSPWGTAVLDGPRPWPVVPCSPPPSAAPGPESRRG